MRCPPALPGPLPSYLGGLASLPGLSREPTVLSDGGGQQGRWEKWEF